jgi:hypothetical protein
MDTILAIDPTGKRMIAIEKPNTVTHGTGGYPAIDG